MATSITTFAGDKCLLISGSDCIIRKMDIPSTAIDVRVGFFATVGGGSMTASTQYIQPISVDDTFRFCMTSGTDIIPGKTPGNYFGIGQNMSAQSSFGAYNTDPNYQSNPIISIFAQISSSLSFTGSGDYNPISLKTIDIKNSSTRAGWHMLRMQRYSSTQIFLYYYNAAAINIFGGPEVPIVLPIPISIINRYLTELNLYANSTWVRRDQYTFNNSTDCSSFFYSINTFFFGWPYYNIPLYIPAMGYRTC